MLNRMLSSIEVWSLSRRFAVTGGAVMLLTMFATGFWVTTKITANAISSSSAATALFMDSFVTPLAMELENADTLSIGPIRALDELTSSSTLSGRVISIKIWKPGGLVAYASNTDLIGKRFGTFGSLDRAFAGEVVAGLVQPGDVESQEELTAGVPLLEIYSPVRANWSGQIIAVAEFYEVADQLELSIRRAWLESWIAVAVLTAIIAASLFGIVNSGSVMIERQRQVLELKVRQGQDMLDEIRRLRVRALRASGKVSDIAETQLRRLSADLHDGPAQLLGLVALRLDALRNSTDAAKRETEIAGLEAALGEALRDIRNICRGLSLPELSNIAFAQIPERAVAAHEARTGVLVARDFEIPAVSAPHAVKTCLYRFIQEGLNNALRHAPGGAVRVTARLDGTRLAASVTNQSATVPAQQVSGGGLGLSGLKERIESLGGTFRFATEKENGATLSMELDLAGGAFND